MIDAGRAERAERGKETRLEDNARAAPPRGLLVALARMLLGAVTIILSVNLWTGFPVLALWVGSHCTGGQVLSMGGVVVVVVTLAAMLSMGVIVLTRISLSYDRLTGRPPPVCQPAPWLLSMNASKAQPSRRRREVSAIERIVVLSVVSAFVAFEVWFFFLATSPLSG